VRVLGTDYSVTLNPNQETDPLPLNGPALRWVDGTVMQCAPEKDARLSTAPQQSRTPYRDSGLATPVIRPRTKSPGPVG